MDDHIIIGKLSLEVEVKSGAESGHTEWPDRLREWLETDFLPKLEGALERLLPSNGETFFLDRLDLDLGQFSAMGFDMNAADELQRLLSVELEESGSDTLKSKINTVASHDREMEALCFFLKTGRLPWWKSPVPDSTPDWESQLEAFFPVYNGNFESLVIVLRERPARKRLLSTFSTSFLKRLWSGIYKSERVEFSDTGDVERMLEENGRFQETEWERGLTLMFGVQKADSRESESFEENTGAPAGPKEEIDSIYIRNAGLVLLHPFLQMLFEELGLADDGRIVKPEKALQILHYLSTGRTGAEWELPLNKLMCGLPLGEVVTTKVRLTSREKEECDRLLQAAIGHWATLGNTSPEGLRGTFLYRDGKLSQKEDGSWLLQVEQKGFDVLLADLPWGISMVKLPWMPEILWVEWA